MDAYSLLRPLIRPLQPETAHHLALKALKYRLVSGVPYDDPVLETELWGRSFRNPIGLAAGFDKDADVPMQALALGFGFVEIGSVTPRPQPGNPKPRLFRLDEDEAVVNRMGFNSKGADNAAWNLSHLPPSRQLGVIGVNLGKNKDTEDAAADYVVGVEKLARFADYIVVNVSSPNTPGLRALQSRAELETLIDRVRDTLERTIPETRPPLLVKVAPDLTDADITDIAAVAMTGAVDGLIATNTTITRPETLRDPQRNEGGGLSGAPLRDLATRVISDFYTATEGRVPIVGVGGVASGADAYAKIRAGASLVQIYSGMVFEGPSLAGRICRSLAGLLKRDGFEHVADAVGADHK